MGNIFDIGYNFKDIKLFQQAITHPSYGASNHIPNYERMEFFGDAILGFIVSDILFHKFPNAPEGELAKRRSALVCGENLSKIAAEIGLENQILLAHSEEKNGGRINKANLENCLEALIAAIYMDAGMGEAKSFVAKHFAKSFDEMKEVPRDPKTTLQEWAQAQGHPIPSYEVIKQEGPAHAPSFTIKATIEGLKYNAESSGKSKKIAERDAAKKLLEMINS